eukprot:m.161681 g.161681  ORF g.161681 m.161681 type:complete len:63 (-) comp18052_c0_seq3:1821-2009(-)
MCTDTAQRFPKHLSFPCIHMHMQALDILSLVKVKLHTIGDDHKHTESSQERKTRCIDCCSHA